MPIRPVRRIQKRQYRGCRTPRAGSSEHGEPPHLWGHGGCCRSYSERDVVVLIGARRVAGSVVRFAGGGAVLLGDQAELRGHEIGRIGLFAVLLVGTFLDAASASDQVADADIAVDVAARGELSVTASWGSKADLAAAVSAFWPIPSALPLRADVAQHVDLRRLVTRSRLCGVGLSRRHHLVI